MHLSVRAESKHGKRLNPRKTDLHRWCETFAEKLCGWGIEAEATRQAMRGRNLRDTPLWGIMASAGERFRASSPGAKSGDQCMRSRAGALEAWAHIAPARAVPARPDRGLERGPDPSPRPKGRGVLRRRTGRGLTAQALTAPRSRACRFIVRRQGCASPGLRPPLTPRTEPKWPVTALESSARFQPEHQSQWIERRRHEPVLEIEAHGFLVDGVAQQAAHTDQRRRLDGAKH